MDGSLGEKIFLKLPGKLGQKIKDSWNDDQIDPVMNNLTVRIQHIMKVMKDTYQETILNSIKTEIKLEYNLSIVESDYNSIKINKTITFDNIQQIIDGLNKISILGEDPTKYWEKDPIICKLDIINPNLIIKTKDIQYGNFEQKCKTHIKALLDLKVIEPSTSPHRSLAFIVNKHLE